jgi:Transposase IS66 family
VLREGERRPAPAGAYPGSICYGPGINTAAVLLSSYGNVPSERTANLIGMLLGIPVSPGFVDLASERLDSRLQDAGFDEAMQAALREEPVLAADETPVNPLDPRAQTAPGGLGVLAHPTDARALVPHPQLPRLGREPRPDCPGRHHPGTR